MLQFVQTFLQTGKVLYVLTGICVLGIISKLVTSSLYKRLIKETENMALTKNKNLQSLKQRTEHVFLISRNLHNTNAYIEKQLYNFRFMNLSLDGWDNLAVQAMILCFLVGGIAAFGTYWYRIDSYYIVLYGSMGILAGLLLVLVDNSVNISLKRQQLSDCLVDYMENSPHFSRPMDRSMKTDGQEKMERTVQAAETKTPAESSKLRLRDMGKRNKMKVLNGVSKKDETRTEPVLSKDKSEKAVEPVKNRMFKPKNDAIQREEQLRKSIDDLKQSLAQIAAAREEAPVFTGTVNDTVPEDTSPARKEISPENIKFLEEIIQEYFS